jgi:hypothetical protein
MSSPGWLREKGGRLETQKVALCHPFPGCLEPAEQAWTDRSEALQDLC